MIIIKNEIGDVLMELNATTLSGADLRGANLYGADLRAADLYEADLRGAHLYEADLRGAGLSRSLLSSADLRWANLSRADLRWATLSNANLRRADLRRAHLSGADLSGANLYEAELRWAILYGIHLHKTMMPSGESWEFYLESIVPQLLAAGGRPLFEVATPENWSCHTWINCPRATAVGAGSEEDCPVLLLPRIKEFIQYFDALLIPRPCAHQEG